MKRRQMSYSNHLKINHSILPLSPLTTAPIKKEKDELLSVTAILALQSQLQSIQGYSLSPGCMVYLAHYCDYHSLLKEIILNKEVKSPKNRFIHEYSRLHSEDNVSKLFTELMDKDLQLRKNSKFYGQECLFDYFRLKEFSPERIVPTLIKRIIEAKRKGTIDFEDKIKKGRSYYQVQQKENKRKTLNDTSLKFQIFEQNKIYYSILALKLLLKQPIPNMDQINKTCEEIKINLQLFLGNLKLRQNKGIKVKRSSIFKKQ